MQKTGTCSTADMQNQHSSKDSIAITAKLPCIIATTSCDIRVQPCVWSILCYELYMACLHTCLTLVMLPVHVLFVRARLF